MNKEQAQFLLKKKITKLLRATKTFRSYFEKPRYANSTGARCIAIDDNIVLKQWYNGCKLVFVFKDGQEIGSIEGFNDEYYDLTKAAERRVKNQAILNL